ncbi:odorant receptor 85b-like isoform X2 [Plutella xylostella]|uniref:odorant receptor 85b-like isoform X2 n=1 Tax=Plutella xylostella TaxID=51655 RepID=UPI002032A062|nr:odorant receptor 85b-like isoform X2 [Plutella xylostella]
MDSIQHFPPLYRKTLSRHFKMFAILGYYIFNDSDKHFLIKYGRLIFFHCYFFVTVLFQVLYLFYGQRQGASLLEIIIAVPFSVLFIQAFAKLPILVVKRSLLRGVIEEMADLWPVSTAGDEEKTRVMQVRLRELKIVDNFLFFFSVFGVNFYNTIPLTISLKSFFSESENLYMYPLQMWIPFTTTTVLQYVIVSTVQITFSALLYISLNLTCELLLVTLVNDLCILLHLLQIDIENVISEAIPTVYDSGVGTSIDNYASEVEILHQKQANQRDYEKIKQLLKTHQKLMSIVERLNDIFGVIIFNSACTSSILICCFCFLTTTARGMDAIMYILSMIGMVFTIFNFAWPGQLLCDASAGISDAAYKCLWYERDQKIKKSIAIIMTRC